MSAQLASVRDFLGSDRRPAPLPAGRRTVVVGSGKGGVGTSTAAALLALAFAEDGSDVLLADASDGHGAQHLLLGLELEIPPEDGPIELDPRERIVRVSSTLSLLPTEESVMEAASIGSPERRSRLRRLSQVAGEYDVVVIDGGSRLASVLAACEAGVGLLLAVTAADRISIAATYALIKAIGMRLGERPVALLGNRIDERTGREAAELVDSATQNFLDRSVEFAGVLPDDACLAAGLAAGMPIQDAAGGSPAAAAMQAIAGMLLKTTGSAVARPVSSPLPRR